MVVIAGAPYAGRQTSRNVQTLADGTRLTRSSGIETMMYRDSAGRTRRELPAFGPPSAGIKPTFGPRLVEVEDPVAGCQYVIDPVHKVAHRVRLEIWKMPDRPKTAPEPRPAVVTTVETVSRMSDGTIVKTESLGTQTIAGVTAEGRRSTTTRPAGSFLGNDRPVTTVGETWIHRGTRVTLLSRNQNPGGGESTTTMEDFSTAEPDPTLFKVPRGYKIVKETGPFKIVIPREPQTR